MGRVIISAGSSPADGHPRFFYLAGGTDEPVWREMQREGSESSRERKHRSASVQHRTHSGHHPATSGNPVPTTESKSERSPSLVLSSYHPRPQLDMLRARGTPSRSFASTDPHSSSKSAIHPLFCDPGPGKTWAKAHPTRKVFNPCRAPTCMLHPNPMLSGPFSTYSLC